MRKKNNAKLGIMFVLPALLLFTVFIIVPLITTVYKSFFEFNGFKLGDFIGLGHFKKVLHDDVFWLANLNTLKMLVVQLAICGPLSFLLAALVRERGERFRRFFKIAVFLPSVLNVAVIALMWKMMLQHDWGLVDRIMVALGLGDHIRLWLQDEQLTIWILGFITLWQYIGFNMMYFYAGIRSIPECYYEAADLAGAGFWSKLKNITIPLTQETIKFVLIISITGTMAIFTQIQLITQGGPGEMTRSLIYQMYYTAFDQVNFGEAGAIAILFALETFFFVMIVNAFVAKDKLEYT